MEDRLEQLRLIQQMLSTTAPRWLYLAEALPDELLTRAPASGEWSAVECLRHLIDAERDVFPVRVQLFLSGQNITPFDPDEEGLPATDATPRQLAEEFARLRTASLGLLGQLTPDDLDRAATHRELGRVTLGEMLNEWVAHDLNHTIQGERALMQPYIVGSGPWRSGFEEHEIGARKSS
jgi:hypothetical protein